MARGTAEVNSVLPRTSPPIESRAVLQTWRFTEAPVKCTRSLEMVGDKAAWIDTTNKIEWRAGADASPSGGPPTKLRLSAGAAELERQVEPRGLMRDASGRPRRPEKLTANAP